METRLCKLTIVYPAAAEEAVLDALQADHLGLRGFTTWRAEGHGLGFETASTQEKLRGRVTRGVLVVIMPRDKVPGALETVRVKIPIPHLVYWLEPVEEMGVLQ